MSGAPPPPAASARTRLCGLIGWPVAHSLSPPMHEAAYAALGLDLRYLAFAVEPARLPEAVAGAAALGALGLNVTVPHKEAVLRLCVPDEQAARVGAVNTLVFAKEGPPRGLNTDVHGVRMLLAEAGIEAAGRQALVLGAGGAARAVLFALTSAGAAVTVASRSGRALPLPGLAPPAALGWEAIAAHLPRFDLLIDATGRSLQPLPPLDLSPLPRSAAVIDLVVRETTPLLAAARAAGLRAVSGEAMLLHQGAQALEAWTGRPAPLAVMRAALADALRASCSR